MHRNYYQILGVARDASSDEIKRAYRRLIQQHHPDRHVDDADKLAAAEELAKQINMAYHVLSDPKARRKYDYDLRYGIRYAAEKQAHPKSPAVPEQPPYRPQFRWHTEPAPTTLTGEMRRWLIGFMVAFILCTLIPLIGIMMGADGGSQRFTPTPEPTITITPET